MSMQGKTQDYDSYCMLGEAFMQIQVRSYEHTRLLRMGLHCKLLVNKCTSILPLPVAQTNKNLRVKCTPAIALPFSQEPEKAVNAFVSAMEFNPKDTELILRVARALVTTHDYAGSIDYYNKVCVPSPDIHRLAGAMWRGPQRGFIICLYLSVVAAQM
eukprot:1157346-Pelagomonas_calceolata.AAC.14